MGGEEGLPSGDNWKWAAVETFFISAGWLAGCPSGRAREEKYEEKTKKVPTFLIVIFFCFFV